MEKLASKTTVQALQKALRPVKIPMSTGEKVLHGGVALGAGTYGGYKTKKMRDKGRLEKKAMLIEKIAAKKRVKSPGYPSPAKLRKGIQSFKRTGALIAGLGATGLGAGYLLARKSKKQKD